MGTTRISIQFQVAKEFGYTDHVIERFLKRKKYKCAADLIEDLDKYDSEEEEEIAATPTVKEEEKNNGDDKATAAAAATPSVTPNSGRKFTLREETEELFRKSVCLCCKNAKRTRVCLPCCHLTHCEKCENLVKVCPYLDCQETVQTTIHTFL